MTLFYSILILIGLCLLVARANTVIDAFDDWNYYVYRYRNYCAVNYSDEEKHPDKVKRNYVSKTEAVLVFFMFWKVDTNNYFSWKPDWEEINELYANKK